MKILLVSSDWDYGVVHFENAFRGLPVQSIINRVEKGEDIVIEDPDGDIELNCEVHEFGPIDERFINFLLNNFIDYDELKHHKFYADTELVP